MEGGREGEEREREEKDMERRGKGSINFFLLPTSSYPSVKLGPTLDTNTTNSTTVEEVGIPRAKDPPYTFR